jgi:glycosyltransferase involved in cell wall biosynthesis
LDVFGRPIIKSHVVFLGSGDVASVMAAASGCAKVHFHPAVPHDQVVRVIQSAQCGICLIEDLCLSLRFSLPNKLFEYAAAGVPVLASRLPEIARVVEEYGLGICCANDADSIEAAVRRIEQDGIEAPTMDLSEISWEAQARRLRDAYRTLLA